MFFIKVAIISSINATTIGHMWSTFFSNMNELIVSAFCGKSFFNLGAGVMAKTGKNPITNAMIWISPMSKTNELVMRTITSKQAAQGFVL